MPQFAVYENPGSVRDILFVVQIQTMRLDHRNGRVVMPLVRRDREAPSDHPLTPHLIVVDTPVYANPLEIVTIAVSRLKAALAVLSDTDGERIIRAVDEMISQA